ncbi:MAG: SRPBCC family protein [Alphaproteobacteria bacterium]|nr:SRPBCC family protein [Alphaproteobacteria bacterium]
MAEVSLKTHLNASADQVWDVIGHFNGLPAWHPMIVESTLDDGGKMRTLTLPDGSKVVEELHDSDDGGHTMTYAIVDSPLPVENYVSTIRVIPAQDGVGCTVEWSSAFDPSGEEGAAINAIHGVYQAGLENLTKMFGT